MYILYLDESGVSSDSSYFVLAGLAVFERDIYFYAQDVDSVQRKYLPDIESAVELHAAPLRVTGAGLVPRPFSGLDLATRRELIREIYQIIRARWGVLFGIAIEKRWCVSENPYERAFEDLTSRFDLFLRRINTANAENEQRGIIVVAESSYRRNLEVLGERFRGGSTRWGQLRNICDVPLFLPAKNTRLLQLADFCANALFGRYNSGLTRDFDIIAPRFDRDQGRIHGLAHLTRDYECQCPACITRQGTML